MAARLFFLPFACATVNGIAQPGAQLFFYQTGTLTKLPIYTTSLFNVQQTNPVVASGAGRFPDVYLDSTQTYRLVVKDKLGATLDDIDPYIPGNIQGLIVPTTQVTAQQFGALGDNVTDDAPSIQAAIDYLTATATDTDGYVKGGGKLFIPRGKYYCATALDLRAGIIIEGEATPGHAPATQLRFPDGTSGIRIQYYTTSGETTTGVAPHSYGDHAILRQIGIVGPLRGTESGITGGEAEWHGVLAKAPFILEDVYINGFRGDGLHCFDDTGTGTGNINVSQVNRLRVTNVRNGMGFAGGDSNACVTIAVNGTYCRQHTIRDESFLGNTHIAPHSANAGIVPGVPSSVVSYSGNRYYVKLGQAVGASTNAPTGTAFSNQWWGYIGAGAAAPTLNIPTWTNGVSVREGGGFFTNNTNARNTIIGAYQEGGEATSQYVSPTVSIGGINTPDTNGNVINGAYANIPQAPVLGAAIVADNSGGGSSASATPLLKVHNKAPLSPSIHAKMDFAQGYETNGTTPCALAAISAYGASATPANANGVLVFATRQVTTNVMTERCVVDGGNGTNGTLRPYADNDQDFGLSTFRWKTSFVYNLNASASILSIGQGGVGYATGAGGTVTQATSRTTGVTLNKVCGQITLFSAAGSATYQTFTVTNSTVAATDSIRVVQASGTDLYQIHVTNVAAGSFKVSFATTGGTTTEAPVFNFSVIKAVAA